MAALTQAHSGWIHAVDSNNTGVAGPFSGDGLAQLISAGIRVYPTQKLAAAAPAQQLSAGQVHTLEQVIGEGPGIGHGFGLGQDISQAGNDITSPLSGLEEIGAVLKAAFDAVTDWRMWASLGWIVLGLVLVIAGLRLWLGPNKLLKPTISPLIPA